MNLPPIIPPLTRHKLNNPAPPGERHGQIIQIACALLSQGLNAQAVFCQLRPNYGADIPDAEIWRVIRWGESKGINVCSRQKPFLRFAGAGKKTVVSPPADAKTDCHNRINRFLNGFSCGEADLWEASPVRPPDDWRDDPSALLASLYSPADKINIVTYFVVRSGKASPDGYGRTLTRDEWLDRLQSRATPQSEAGAWVRMNPTDGNGIADDSVTAFRFALIEFDGIAPALQLSILAKLPLPINAILTSGGKSLHAWVLVNASNVESYRQTVSEMLALLKGLGVDTGNKNPSRLSRLPGVQRTIGATGEGCQRLLYLNPKNTKEETIL